MHGDALYLLGSMLVGTLIYLALTLFLIMPLALYISTKYCRPTKQVSFIRSLLYTWCSGIVALIISAIIPNLAWIFYALYFVILTLFLKKHFSTWLYPLLLGAFSTLILVGISYFLPVAVEQLTYLFY